MKTLAHKIIIYDDVCPMCKAYTEGFVQLGWLPLENRIGFSQVPKAILDKIDSNTIAETIIVGSLVKANGIYLYLSVALPKISVEGINVIALSPQSPLGNKLMGNEVGFTFEINGTKYVIETIQ